MAATMTQRRPHKRERLAARVTAENKTVIAHAAVPAGKPAGGLMVAEAHKSGLQTLKVRERIVLNEQESQRFVERLLAPPRPPNPRLLADMRDYKARVKSDLD